MKQKALSDSQTAQLCKGLALVLHGGVPLPQGASWLAESAGREKPVLENLARELEQGGRLWEAMEAQGVFSGYVTGLTRAGEETGRLEEALLALAEFHEARDHRHRQMKNALTGPVVLFAVMLVVIGVLLIRVLPVFDDVYAGMGTGLTGPALVLLELGRWLEGALPWLGAAAAVLALLAALPPVRRWCLGLYGDRGVFRRYNNAHALQVMAMGLSSGLPLEEAVELARELLEDVPQARQRCEGCRQAMAAGADLETALADARFLTPAQGRLLQLGFRGGNGDRVLTDLARQQSRDAQDAAEAAIARVEPGLVLAASVLVGVILLAVMLPLVNIMQTLG